VKGYWLHCAKCNLVVPYEKFGYDFDWHKDCKVFDRYGRPKGMSKKLDYASHPRAYAPMKATSLIKESAARFLLARGRAEFGGEALEWLALAGDTE
jgi:hypothetical protein